ncbi:MAG: TPR end-of-group domain-containing protein [Candidatus Aminicenantales bacterium]
MKSPKCQAENPETSLFCAGCGAKLDAAGELFLFKTETLQTPLKKLTTGSAFAGRYQIIVYALWGMKDEAIDAMQKSLSKGGFYRYLALTSNPFHDNLRGDPRFDQIVAQEKKKYEDRSEKYGDIFQGKRP